MDEKGLDYFEMKIEKEAWQIGEAFLQGILLEISSFPKPGLVSSKSMGSHRDMNILTFMVSSAVISSGFTLCAQAGRNHKGAETGLIQNNFRLFRNGDCDSIPVLLLFCIR